MTADRLTLAERSGPIFEDQALKPEILGNIGARRGDRRGSQFDLVNNFDSSRPSAEVGELDQIILKIGRPVLFVQNDGFAFPKELKDRESQVLKERLEGAMEKIKPRIPSVGRINVQNNETFTWLSTGGLIAENIGVSNAHVVDEFAMKTADERGYTFRQNFRCRSVSASIDVKVEFESPARNEFQIDKVLFIGEKASSGNCDPDIALFRISSLGSIGISKQGEPVPAVQGKPLGLADHPPDLRDQVTVIGYPAFDSRGPDADLMRRIFGDDYDLKRLEPGTIMGVDDEFHVLRHDASTLGGNSGSVILDLETGEAVGLHFAGSFLDLNYAVPAVTVRAVLHQFAE
jgi:endonuclease G